MSQKAGELGARQLRDSSKQSRLPGKHWSVKEGVDRMTS